jgi:hypothetical protein
MLRLRSEFVVEGITGRQITDFLLDCSDERYQEWWPGTHLRLHPLARGVLATLAPASTVTTASGTRSPF